MTTIRIDIEPTDDLKRVLRDAMCIANVITGTVTLPVSRGRKRFVVPRGKPYHDEHLMACWQDWHIAGGPAPPPPPPDN